MGRIRRMWGEAGAGWCAAIPGTQSDPGKAEGACLCVSSHWSPEAHVLRLSDSLAPESCSWNRRFLGVQGRRSKGSGSPRASSDTAHPWPFSHQEALCWPGQCRCQPVCNLSMYDVVGRNGACAATGRASRCLPVADQGMACLSHIGNYVQVGSSLVVSIVQLVLTHLPYKPKHVRRAILVAGATESCEHAGRWHRARFRCPHNYTAYLPSWLETKRCFPG